MTTVLLILLTVLLVVAAAYVGLLLLRRSRPATSAEGETDGSPQTVGDLVRLRTTPPEDVSGDELFKEKMRAGAAAAPVAPSAGASDDAARTAVVKIPQPAGATATPPEGLEAGDAPWRRAARMRGDEPGAAWDTAPIPVVEEAAPKAADAPAGETAVVAPAEPTSRTDLAPTGSGVKEPVAVVESADDESGVVKPIAAEAGVAEPAEPISAEPGVAEPIAAEPVALQPAPVEPVAAEAASVEPAVEPVAEPAPVEPLAAAPDAPVPADTPSRPLSDPEMTPLMGIPIVRPAAADEPLPDVPPALPADLVTADAGARDEQAGEPLADPSDDGGLPAPLRRMSAPRDDDEEEVVVMAPITAPIPVVGTGSPQPVWFRVVRRDGEPVAAAVVSLLDPYGREVDTTKTATDGGGELRTPHGGRFLMIVSAEGFQPRAALLTVEEQPVEIALLLPRSATVSGAVRGGDGPIQGATVVARQEGQVVDQTGTGPDGTFRFADLAEGVYALAATDRRGSAVRQVTLTEGADLQFDLDLVADDTAR